MTVYNCVSSRGVSFTTWGSRGSALANKIAFQQIATAPNVHVYWTIVLIKSN